jgi:hypothetical protein
MAMYGPELRTYALGAVVSVLLGAGTGFGWHYFADSAGRRVAAAPATPLAQQDAPNPASSNQAGERRTGMRQDSTTGRLSQRKDDLCPPRTCPNANSPIGRVSGSGANRVHSLSRTRSTNGAAPGSIRVSMGTNGAARTDAVANLTPTTKARITARI